MDSTRARGSRRSETAEAVEAGPGGPDRSRSSLPRAAAERDGAVWLALALATLVLLPNETPLPELVLIELVLTGVLLLSFRFRVGPLAIASLLFTGITLRRVFLEAGYSDVLVVTQAAIERVLAGLNPYGVGYPMSVPPGSPFPYGPLALLWYLPFRDAPWDLEQAIALALLLVLALRGRPLGLALYAIAPSLVTTASDRSNDTSAGVLLLVAALALARSPRLGGVALAAAVAFKPYALAWAPPLVVWSPVAGGLAFLLASVALWAPAVLLWGAPAIAASIAASQDVHRRAYYSLAYVLEWMTGRPTNADAFERLRLGLGLLTTAAVLPFARTPRAVVVGGIAIYLVTLFTGYWGTHSYIAAIAPLVCWHLDDWVGLGRQRVRWPGDPVGRLTRWIDARWPPLDEHPSPRDPASA